MLWLSGCFVGYRKKCICRRLDDRWQILIFFFLFFFLCHKLVITSLANSPRCLTWMKNIYNYIYIDLVDFSTSTCRSLLQNSSKSQTVEYSNVEGGLKKFKWIKTVFDQIQHEWLTSITSLLWQLSTLTGLEFCGGLINFRFLLKFLWIVYLYLLLSAAPLTGQHNRSSAFISLYP